MHLHDDHAKQSRKEKKENRTTALEEYAARKIRRAVRFGSMPEDALTERQNCLLQRLKAGQLRMPKPDPQREGIVTKLARLQDFTFQ